MDAVVVTTAALVGLIAGPTLGRVTDRLPGRLPFGADLDPRTLVPIRSWFGPVARTRGGGVARRRDPIIDLASAALVATLVAVADTPAQAVGLGVGAMAFVVLAVIDLEHHRLPDAVVFPALGAVLGAAVVGVAGGAPLETLTGALVGATAEFALFLVMALVTPGWVGLGDVKLALLLGAVAGWVGASIPTAAAGPIGAAVSVCMYALLLGSILAVVFGAVRALQVRRRFGLRPSRARHVVLVGPMGAGKSSLGEWVASVIGRPFVDLDAEVEERTGRTVAEIFAGEGEPEFRRIESEVLAAALAERRPALIATGGGAVLDEGSRTRMREGSGVVWLDAEPDVLVGRVGRADDRPLLAADPTAIARIRAEREPLYTAVAHARIDTGGLPEAEARRRLDQVVSGLLGYFPFGPPLIAGTVLAVVLARPLLG